MASQAQVSGPPKVPTGSGLVAVLVGRNPHHRVVLHKNLICAASAFFVIAVKHASTTLGSPTIELPEEHISNFAALVDWLYKDNPEKTPMLPSINYSSGKTGHHFISLLEIFAMADRLMVPGLKLAIWAEVKNMCSRVDPWRPYDEILHSLQQEDLPYAAEEVKTYIENHIMFWLCANNARTNVWLSLTYVNLGFAGAPGLAVKGILMSLAARADDKAVIFHPYLRVDDVDRALDVVGLKREARELEVRQLEQPDSTLGPVQNAMFSGVSKVRGEVSPEAEESGHASGPCVLE